LIRVETTSETAAAAVQRAYLEAAGVECEVGHAARAICG
jgi:hypothetical protein